MSAQAKAVKIPASYFCSITRQVMMDPVFTADGQTYEREAIEEWLKTHDTSPKTGQKLPNKQLTPNWDKKGDISELLAEHPELYERDEVYLPKAWLEQLVIAIKGNKISSVQEWLDKDKRLLTTKLAGNYKAFHLACEFGSANLTNILLEKLQKSNQLDKVLEKPSTFKPTYLNVFLEQSLINKDKSTFTLLLQLGAELEHPGLINKNTLLHRMVIQGHLEAVSWLLEQGANLESVNAEGNTPLLLAILYSVLHNKIEIIEFLLTKKANVNVKNNKGETPLSIALLTQNKAMLSLLLGEKKAILPALHLALELSDIGILKALLEQKDIAIEALDEEKRTPFLAAVEKGNIEVAKSLLEKGANPAVIGGTKLCTALHIAVEHNNLEILKLLLETKAASLIDIPNVNGDAPLHIAAKSGQEEIITLLLKAGAFHKIKNAQNQTPMDVARAQKQIKTASFIEQTVRAIKQAKLEEITILRQTIKEQAKRIEQLENNNTRLDGQLDTLSKQMSEMQKRLIPESAPQSNNNNLSSVSNFLPQYGASVNPNSNLNPKEVSQFLAFVVAGKQDEAEKMLKKNKEIALSAGDVTDHAKRTFRGITGFQYAVWALDWHMWTMIRKYLPDDAARKQAEGFATGSWVKEHGEHASWKKLLDAQQTLIDKYDEWDDKKCNEHWVQQVGGAQLILPMHVLQEYCQPNRPFYPCPNFKGSSKLTRALSEGIELSRVGTETALLVGGTACSAIGSIIFRWNIGGHMEEYRITTNVGDVLPYDMFTLAELSSTRTQQRGELVTELKNSNTPAVRQWK